MGSSVGCLVPCLDVHKTGIRVRISFRFVDRKQGKIIHFFHIYNIKKWMKGK